MKALTPLRFVLADKRGVLWANQNEPGFEIPLMSPPMT
jgi:hypothetical protein